jgi:hypothetical protein
MAIYERRHKVLSSGWGLQDGKRHAADRIGTKTLRPGTKPRTRSGSAERTAQRVDRSCCPRPAGWLLANDGQLQRLRRLAIDICKIETVRMVPEGRGAKLATGVGAVNRPTRSRRIALDFVDLLRYRGSGFAV